MRKSLVLIISLLIIASCEHKQDHAPAYDAIPKKTEIRGYEVSKDNLNSPKVIPAGKPKKLKAGIPQCTLRVENTPSHYIPRIVPSGMPEICVPGSNNYSFPETVPAVINPVVAGTPKMVLAEKANIMENSLENFSSYGKLQGLKANTVHCITQDDFGNIWFGTAAGLSRYDGKYFTHYTVNEGLCNNNVISIIIDKNNNLWAGTQYGGVSKFDGKFFTNFSENEGLAGSNCLGIIEDKKGNIWFGTQQGLSRFDGKTFTRYTMREGLIADMVYSIYEDKTGNIWAGTDGGVSRFDGQAFTNYTVKDGLCFNLVHDIIEDKDGNIWFATDCGISRFDGVSFYNYTGDAGISDKPVYSILEDVEGNIWIGTWGDGIYKYDGEFIHHYTEKDGLVNDEINNIFQDSNGILWFGTRAGGAIKFGGNKFHHYTAESGMSKNQVQSILPDSKGNLWCGTWGLGVCKYDGKSFSWYTNKEGLLNDDVRCIIEDRDGNIWFATCYGVTKFDGEYFTEFTDKEGLCNRFVISAIQDKEGNFWFGTEGGGVSKYDGENFVNYTTNEGLSDNTIRAIVEDKYGNIWFATKNGITRYEPTKEQDENYGTFTHFTDTEGLPNNDIISLLVDRAGNLWIGAFGGGVTKYDGKDFTYYTEKQGLNENGIMSILEDRNGNIWFGSRTGISEFPKELIAATSKDFTGQKLESNIFKNYTYEDGFFGIGCNANSICEDKDGIIWIGANDRLTALNPYFEDPEVIPNIQLTGIDLFNEQMRWNAFEKDKDTSIILSNGILINQIQFDGLSNWYNIPENLSLAHDDNFLTFNFIGISTKSPKSIKYKYKLDGLDESWSILTNQTTVSYGNLHDGSYSFKVVAMNKEGKWSDEFSYSFSIRPPWWKTKTAYLIYFLGFIMWIFIVDRIQTRRVVAKERERTRDRELQLAGKIKQAYEKLHIEHEIVEKQKDELELEQRRSDALLRNILPEDVATELKETGLAKARYMNEVTVLFTDFKDFTHFAEGLSPQVLVAEIHECFSMYDEIMEKHGVEKIKTIGDSYMAAGGLPRANQSHPFDVINAALDIQQFMFELKQRKVSEGKPFLEVRIGIHTGPVVAGIVGVKKFVYDIWGDTVNTASHMEKSGEVGRINISSMTYQLVKDHYTCEYRGKIEAKHKGMIDMYFINCC